MQTTSLQMPDGETLSKAKASRLSAALVSLADAASLLTGQVPQAERDSWPTKAAAARACLAGVASPDQTAMLMAEAAIMGEALEDLAPVIVAKADAYGSVAARLAGLRRQVTKEIDAALTPEETQAALVALDAALINLGEG